MVLSPLEPDASKKTVELQAFQAERQRAFCISDGREPVHLTLTSGFEMSIAWIQKL